MADYNTRLIEIYNIIAPKYYSCREDLALLPELDAFMNLVPDGGLILDAGCGNGRDIKIFSDRGYQCVGLDGSKKQLRYAFLRSYKTDVKFECVDLRTYHSTLKFDGIWCNAVLPHFRNSDIMIVLSMFKRQLRNNGIILATFKEGSGDRMVVEPEFDNCTRYTNFHNKSDIEHFAGQTGLKIIDIHYYNERERFQKHNRDLNFIVATFSN